MRTFCYTVLLVLACTICAAFYFGVFTMTTEREESGRKISLIIHTDRLTSAEQKAKEFIGQAKADGLISAIDESDHTFTLATSEKQELVFHIDANSNISGTPPRGLQVGDRVNVTYETKDGKHLARKVTIEQGN